MGGGGENPGTIFAIADFYEVFFELVDIICEQSILVSFDHINKY